MGDQDKMSFGYATYPVDYEYDIYGNKIAMTTYRTVGGVIPNAPQQGDTTHWFYDESSGTLTNKLYADGQGPRYEYDANGRLAKRIWARGVETFYAYDGWGNLTNTTYSDNTPTIALCYDAMGRQVEAHDAAGVTTFTYKEKIVAHERGHAQAYFEYAAKWSKESIEGLTGTKKTAKAIHDIASYIYHLQLHQDVYLKASAEYANRSTHNWYLNNGWAEVNRKDGVIYYEKKE